MNQASAPRLSAVVKPRSREQAHARIVIVGLACFLAGLAAGALWVERGVSRRAAQAAAQAAGNQAVALSASTTAVLQQLNSPMEIRFYRSLDPASVAASEQAFAGRVEQLLAAFERGGGGKIKVTRYRFQPNSGVEHAAEADGIQPFNLDKGDACFLGLAVVGRGTKESLARLWPEWEPALEFDLARAIARAAEAGLQAQALAVAPQADALALEEVRRAIPNLDSVSLEAGTRLLREAAVSEFARAAQELEARLRQAQQNLVRAQSNHSEAQEQAALKQLQQVQAEQPDKLKQIAARSQAQIQALTRLKATGH